MNDPRPSGLDVTTLATLQGALRSAVDEMNHVVVRTARSPVFKLAKDFSCSLCDWACRQMVQGRAELPVQVGSIPFVCRATADAYAGDLADGDLFLCNDPASGGLHLNDVALLQPVFVEGTLMFWTVIRAHWQDVGGVAAADLRRAQSDAWGEGVRMPPLRIARGGAPRDDVLRLLFANLRFAERTRSDLLSMQAASRIAAGRLRALVARYGRDTVRAGIEELYDRLERQARAAIAALADGRYVGRSPMAARDDGPPIEFTATVDVRGDALAVRIDSPPQSRDVRNSPYAATFAAAGHAVAVALGIRPPFNDGLYRAVSIDCGPPGSTANAQVPPTATLGCTTQPFCELVDCVRAALAQAINPERLNAGWGAAASTNVFGHDPRTGAFYGHFLPNAGSAGGAGAVHGADGWSGVGSEANGGAVLLEPVELLEYELPIRVQRMELRTDSGGAGRWRGGLGLDFEWEVLEHAQTAQFRGVVDVYPALGVGGAHSSLVQPKLGVRRTIDPDGTVRDAGRDSRLHSTPGGRFAMGNPGGGGVGDSFARDPAAVLDDVRDDLVSREGAERDYGVAIAADGLSVDEERTRALRERALMDRLGIDIGGTFTDFVLVSPDGRIEIAKALSNPADLRAVIASGLAQLAAARGVDVAQLLRGVDLVVHGTTIATNALIQRRLAKVGLIATKGFRDVLALREGYKEEVYDYFLRPPEPLVPRRRCLTVHERIGSDGSVLDALRDADVAAAASAFRREGVEAVAVGLLWSVVNDVHERRVAQLLHAALPGVPVFLSSSVSPELREYPRLSTTVLCAALANRLDTYLHDLEANLREVGFSGAIRYIQCNGGTTSGALLRARPVLALDSGPAAGPVAGLHFARRLGTSNVVTLDMGGTSLDVSLVEDGQVETAKNLDVHRHRVSLPMVRVHTIGAGGGSIAWVDGAGLLQVGPQSAESLPGPACYARGGEAPTVTDANVVLGYFNREALLGGRMPIRRERAEAAIASRLAVPLDIDVAEAAHAVHAIVNENMADAVRQMSTERGHDVRDFVVVCGGGCSAAHAAGIAQILGVRTVVVPRVSSVLCAFGAAISEVRHDYARMHPVRLAECDGGAVAAAFEATEAQARDELALEGFEPQRQRLTRTMDVRYRGEVSELTVDVTGIAFDTAGFQCIAERFHALHERTYTFADPDSACELMSLGVVARGLRNRQAAGDDKINGASRIPEADVARRSDAASNDALRAATPTDAARDALVNTRDAWFGRRWTPTPVYDGPRIDPGARIEGPAIVEEPTTTVVVPPGWRISRTPHEAWELTRIENGAWAHGSARRSAPRLIPGTGS